MPFIEPNALAKVLAKDAGPMDAVMPVAAVGAAAAKGVSKFGPFIREILENPKMSPFQKYWKLADQREALHGLRKAKKITAKNFKEAEEQVVEAMRTFPTEEVYK